jgi:hypothetical protein
MTPSAPKAAELPQPTTFERVDAADALSNLYGYNYDKSEPFECGPQMVLPAKRNFHNEIMSALK